MKPIEYVLLGSLGKSPAVISECILSLKDRGKIVKKLLLVTTKGTEMERELLELGFKYAPSFEEFRDINIKFFPIDKEDINSPDDVRSFRISVNRAFKSLKKEERNRLVINLAGGRKTMPIDLYLLVSLIEGVEETYHVLVEKEDMIASYQKKFQEKWGNEIKRLIAKSASESLPREFIEDIDKLLNPKKLDDKIKIFLVKVPTPKLNKDQRERLRKAFFLHQFS